MYPWQPCQMGHLWFTHQWRRWRTWTCFINISSTDSTAFHSTALHKWWKGMLSSCKPACPCVCVLPCSMPILVCNPRSLLLQYQSIRMGQWEEDCHTSRELPDSKSRRQLWRRSCQTACQKGMETCRDPLWLANITMQQTGYGMCRFLLYLFCISQPMH